MIAHTPTDVLVAGYRNIDEATKDFEALVKEKVSIDGAILVTHAEDGSVAAPLFPKNSLSPSLTSGRRP